MTNSTDNKAELIAVLHRITELTLEVAQDSVPEDKKRLFRGRFGDHHQEFERMAIAFCTLEDGTTLRDELDLIKSEMKGWGRQIFVAF